MLAAMNGNMFGLQFPRLLRNVAEQVSEQDQWYYASPLAAAVQPQPC